MKNRAFTLIELLVVVLIIGILAAIAVPKYQKAVARSRFLQLKALAEAVATAQDAYYLANGKYTTSFYNLDISMPPDKLPSSWGGYFYYDWGDCWLEREKVACALSGQNQYHLYYDGKWRSCISFSKIGEAVCQLETNNTTPVDGGNYKSWPYQKS